MARGSSSITGANGGGKSTFLRAVGLAQVMLQAGMFVAAERLSAERSIERPHPLHARGGRRDGARQARTRSSAGCARVIDACSPASLVLLNESLSSTNEREGAEIARQVVTALADSGVRVWFVTHNHQFAADLHRAGGPASASSAPSVGEGDERSFRIMEGPPEATSHGMDLYAG